MISDRTRQLVLRRDRFRCRLCGASSMDGTTTLEVDHKKPVSLGGSDEIFNLWTLCKKCNRGKAAFFDDSVKIDRNPIIDEAKCEHDLYVKNIEIEKLYRRATEWFCDDKYIFSILSSFYYYITSWDDLYEAMRLFIETRISLRVRPTEEGRDMDDCAFLFHCMNSSLIDILEKYNYDFEYENKVAKQ